MFGIFMFILDLQYIIYKYIYTTIQKFGVCHVIKSILKKNSHSFHKNIKQYKCLQCILRTKLEH